MLTQYKFALSRLSGIPRFWTRIFLGGLAVLLAFLPISLQAQSPLTIQSSTGNVGIGTTSPGALMHLSSGAGGTKLQVSVTSSPATDTDLLRFDAAGDFDFRFKSLWGQNRLVLWDQSNARPLMSWMYTNGNVGIGTTSPQYKLDVTGNADIIHAQGTTGNAFFRATTVSGMGDFTFGVDNNSGAGNNAFIIYDRVNDAYRLVLNNSGNVGIGTASPGRKLHVGPGGINALTTPTQILVSGASGTSAAFAAYEPSTGAEAFLGTQSGDPQVFVGAFSNHPLALVTNNAERIRITNTGNVGIGTLSPTSRLHVLGDITATGAKNFQIDHPLEPDKKLLVHSALEGPEVAVYYRGEAQLVDGEVSITLPSYFEALTRKEQRTVQLTPIKGWSPLYVADEIQDGRFKVRTTEGGNLTQRFYWEVKAIRADVAPLVVEKTKEAENMRLTANSKNAD